VHERMVDPHKQVGDEQMATKLPAPMMVSQMAFRLVSALTASWACRKAVRSCSLVGSVESWMSTVANVVNEVVNRPRMSVMSG
jgi:hypothetical protein